MMTLPRPEIEEHLEDFDDEDHMNFVGKFRFVINETCLSCDHQAFLVAATG